MGKPQKMDQQTVSEIAAIVTDELLSSEAFRNIIEQSVQKGLEKNWIKLMKDWIFFIPKSLTYNKKLINAKKEVCDVKEFIESNDVLCHQMQTHINELEQYSRRNSIRIFGIEKQTNDKLTETICKFSRQKLNIDLQPHFIDRCHPVGNYRNRNTVLVKFVSYKHKQ